MAGGRRTVRLRNRRPASRRPRTFHGRWHRPRRQRRRCAKPVAARRQDPGILHRASLPQKKDPVGPARVPTGSSGNRETSVPGHARQRPSFPRRSNSAGSAVRYQLLSLVVKACNSRDGQLVREVALGRQTPATGLLSFKTVLPFLSAIGDVRVPLGGQSREALDAAASGS